MRFLLSFQVVNDLEGTFVVQLPAWLELYTQSRNPSIATVGRICCALILRERQGH